MKPMTLLTPETRSACDSLTNNPSNLPTWKSQMTLFQIMRNGQNHNHPVLPEAVWLDLIPCNALCLTDMFHPAHESIAKKARVDVSMDDSAVEAPTKSEAGSRSSLATDRVLHHLRAEVPNESEDVSISAELMSLKDKQLYTEVYEVISGKWVLKQQGHVTTKARYVL